MLKFTINRTFVGLTMAVGLTLAIFAHPARAQELSWAAKMFDAQKHDFGVVARGSDVRHRMKVKNLYEQTVHISNVRTTCGCSAAKPTTNTLAKGEEAFIEITMDTRKFIRRKDSNLIVTFDAPLFAEVQIPITAYIRTDVVLDPGSVGFGIVDHGTSSLRKISISYAGRNDWKIKDVESKSKYVIAKVVETARAEGRVKYDLLVTLKPDAPVGELRGQLTLITDDAENPKVPILVEARVEADITVTPAVVSLGMLTPGIPKTFNVVVRGKKAFEIAKLESDSNDGIFKVRLPNSARQVHVLALTITPPNKPGTFSEEFTVTIVGRDEPVTFKTYGKIGESGS